MGDEAGKDTPNIAEELEQFGEKRGLIREGLTLRHRVDPERSLLVTDDRIEGVKRTYLNRVAPNNFLEASGLYHLYPNGVIKIRRGYYHTAEGTQEVVFAPTGPNSILSFGLQADLDVEYDVNSIIGSISFGWLYPKDEVRKNEGGVRVSFIRKNISTVSQSDSGIYKIINEDDFVECVKTVDGEVVLRYRVPKKINKDEILGNLVPADLRDYPYEAPGAADMSWMNTDLLAAFGIERLPV